MKAVFLRTKPYCADALNLPVADVEAAIPYYEKTFGFRVAERADAPHRAVILERDSVRIGLAENGGDPTQDGCFFEVDDLAAAYEEIRGGPPPDSAFRADQFNGVPFRVFFVVAPDGLCYMLGQRQA